MGNLEKSVLEMPIDATVMLKSVKEGIYSISMNSSSFRTYITYVMGDICMIVF